MAQKDTAVHSLFQLKQLNMLCIAYCREANVRPKNLMKICSNNMAKWGKLEKFHAIKFWKILRQYMNQLKYDNVFVSVQTFNDIFININYVLLTYYLTTMQFYINMTIQVLYCSSRDSIDSNMDVIWGTKFPISEMHGHWPPPISETVHTS